MAKDPNKQADDHAKSSSIIDFKSKLSGGGARPNLFYVEFTGLYDTDDSNTDETKKNDNEDINKFSYLCKAAQIPASVIASIDVPFRGRILKVAGDRTFEPWTITVINDQDFSVRERFELWMQKIAQYTDASGDANPTNYYKSATVYQLGRGGSGKKAEGDEVDPTKSAKSDLKALKGSGLRTIKKYNFYDIFPTNLGAIELNYESTNAIEEFTVELQVNYWESV